MGGELWEGWPNILYLPRTPCPSVQLWQGTVAAGYGDGQIRIYEASSGVLHVQINAHARGISALDLAPEAGKVSRPRPHSVGDCVWEPSSKTLSRDP